MNFMKWRWLYFLISLLVIVPGFISLIVFGLKPAIDFTGGSLLEINFIEITENQELSVASLEESLDEVYELSSIQQSGENRVVLKGKHIIMISRIKL